MTTQQIVDVLNDALETDPQAVKLLTGFAVPCNEAMGNHPAIQVRVSEDKNHSVRIIGILNAIAAIDKKIIWEDYEKGDLVRFRLTEELAPVR